MKDAMDFFLAFGMLATGSINTIVTKEADGVCQRNSHNAPLLYDPTDTTKAPFWGPENSDPSNEADKEYQPGGGLEGYQCVQFNHPFVQAAFMFIGEILCGIVFIIMRLLKKGEPMPYFNPLYLAVAGMCDMTATSMMYVGLTMTYASTFQILRGFVVVTTALFSQFVLKRKQQNYQWLGVVMVVVGTAVVGSAPYVGAPFGTKTSGASDASASNPTLGNLIIVLAQVVVGVQMCWEERYVTEYNIPALLVVGWEGFFGLFAISIVITVVHQIHDFSPGNPADNYALETAVQGAHGSWEAPPGTQHENQTFAKQQWGGGDSNTVYWFGEQDAFDQFSMPKPNNPRIMIAMIAMIFSIAFFNFFGISVTKKLSAAHRMVLDSVRTCVVWTVGLVFFGERFAILQLIGFLILIAGTLVYNVIFRVPGFDYSAYDTPEEEDPVLKGRKNINKAIADRDFSNAERYQKDLAMLGDQRYASRVSSLDAPLLTPGSRAVN